MDFSEGPEAARRFCHSFPEPVNPAGRAQIRSTLIEISSRWGDGCHVAIRSRCFTLRLRAGHVGWSGAELVRELAGASETKVPGREQFYLVGRCILRRDERDASRKPRPTGRRHHHCKSGRPASDSDDIAHCVGAHPASVRRAFHREFHKSLRDYHFRARVERAEFMLRSTPLLKVETVALAVGWGSRKDLYRAVRKVRG